MKPQSRSLLGIALFLPLAAILLVTFACLPAPVGNPETAKIDNALIGAWKGEPSDPADKSTTLVLIQPWDAHTYFLQYYSVETRDGKETHQMLPMKAWLADLGATFLVTQPLDDLTYAIGDTGQKPYWPVLRLDKTNAGFDIRMVQADSDLLKGLTKSPELEAAIKAHVDDKSLYAGTPLSFKKLGKEDQAFIESVLAKFTAK